MGPCGDMSARQIVSLTPGATRGGVRRKICGVSGADSSSVLLTDQASDGVENVDVGEMGFRAFTAVLASEPSVVILFEARLL